ncbi:MAG: hypothetical protein FWF90_06720 [Promicromonosporaceae bacterium]|nr:hypothetical protein [Promicromonosporaceae bacterium]
MEAAVPPVAAPSTDPWLAPKRWWQLAAVALVLVAGALLATIPVYAGSSTAMSDGTTTTVDSNATLFAVNGPAAVLPLVLPLLLAALPLPWRGKAWQVTSIVSAAVLWVFCLLAGFTIGLWMVPAAVCALVAACLPVRPERTGAAS